MQRHLALGASLLCLAVMPGCIAWDIHDQLVTINSNVDAVVDRVDEANKRLDTTNAELDVLQAVSYTHLTLPTIA